MKKTFDWMREQTQKESIEICCGCGTSESKKGIFLENEEKIINEAESKWEAECEREDFEWRINEVLPMLEEKCLYGTASLIKAMADALGINISEVER